MSRTHAGSAPLDFYFGLVAKINIIIRAKSKQASCTEMVLGAFPFFARVIQQLGFGARNFKQTSTAATAGVAPCALRSALDLSV